MWIYTCYYPKNEPITLNGQRIDQLYAGQAIHEHRNNYTTHQGFGRPGGEALGPRETQAVQMGRAYLKLPKASATNSPYVEAVWEYPGLPVGSTRLIVNQNDLHEIYFTDDHYRLYWKVTATDHPGSKML